MSVSRTAMLENERQRLTAALRIRPGDARLHHALGAVLYAQRRPIEALRSYEASLRLRPDLVESHNDRGLALQALGRQEEAVASYSAAIRLRPDYPEAHYNRANVLAARREFEAAAADYRKAIARGLQRAEVYNNLGLALQESGHMAEGIENLRLALAANPAYAEAWYNLAFALARIGRHEEALAGYERALAARPDYAQAHAARGQLLMEANRPAEALASLERALRLEAAIPWLRGAWLYARLNLCEWAGFDAEVSQLALEVAAGRGATAPLFALYMLDSPPLLRRAAEVWAAATDAQPDSPARRVSAQRGAKVRLGYFSADFRTHPVAALTAGMFEHHDRSRFELFALSFGPAAEDAMRTRLRSSFDHFLDVDSRSDAGIAELSRSLGIDIAVDLQGFTRHQRPGIFARRAAPLQVAYLGYPGTQGTTCIDYLIADRIVIPEESRVHYAEKIAYLPHCFQVNDCTRPIADRVFSRAELGLPPSGFVFCCFNNTCKITPETFDSWMRILSATPGSVLFLLSSSSGTERNLCREAVRRGIAPERLVFGGRLSAQEYLARYRAADLFLDTLPYNAGTTAADSLWAGLPILTLPGNSFASRMAASLLTAAGLPELIAGDRADYERRAIELAADGQRLETLKRRLAANRSTCTLFDTAACTRHMEAAYEVMLDRFRDGRPPEHLDLSLTIPRPTGSAADQTPARC